MRTNHDLTTPPAFIRDYKILGFGPKVGHELGSGWVIFCQNGEGMWVVASWYPHYGDREWHQGYYCEDFVDAMKKFKEMVG